MLGKNKTKNLKVALPQDLIKITASHGRTTGKIRTDQPEVTGALLLLGKIRMNLKHKRPTIIPARKQKIGDLIKILAIRLLLTVCTINLQNILVQIAVKKDTGDAIFQSL